VTEPLGWLEPFAAQSGLTYEALADERWLRAWEPFVTLRTPIRYEHSLNSTGELGSLTIARFTVDAGGVERTAWLAIAQDTRLVDDSGQARAAAAFDVGPSGFGDALELVSLPRRFTGDVAFDRTFASFAADDASLARVITPSVRKLVLGWNVPLHFELRPGGFVLAPVGLGADPQSLAWLLGAARFFGDKAAKRARGRL
jgi:hypothetical protein